MTSARYTHNLDGTVVDKRLENLYGVKVTVLNPDGSPSSLVDTTDFTGHYQITAVPQGTRIVRFELDGYQTNDETIFMANSDKTFNVQMLAVPIDPPSDFAATVINWNQVSLAWTERDEASLKGYNLYRSTTADGQYTKVNTDGLITGDSYLDVLPTNDSNYYYKSTSVNIDDVEGPLSSPPVSVTPQSAGDITSNTTWAGTLIITGDVTVKQGATLTIEPGTTIRFDGSSWDLFIEGVLSAQGTAENQITFTSNQTTPNPGDWRGIDFTDSSNDSLCIISYATVEYAWRGIECILASPTITNNTITGNSNEGIYCGASSPTISNNTITENSGQGIYCSSSSPTISNNTITGNSGQGIYCHNSSPTITDNSITGNSHGILCGSSSPTISNNTIAGNLYTGIYCGSSSPTISNNTITGNSSYGIYCYSSSPTVTSNTIMGNRDDGIYCTNSSSSTVSNTILWNKGSREIYVSGDSSLTITYSDIQGGWEGEGNIDADPMFVDAANEDYHLQAGSPCIDASTSDNAPDKDKDGNSRYDDPNTPNTGGGSMKYYDMGAYEYRGN